MADGNINVTFTTNKIGSHDIDMRGFCRQSKPIVIKQIIDLLESKGLKLTGDHNEDCKFIIPLMESGLYMMSTGEDWHQAISPRDFLSMYEDTTQAPFPVTKENEPQHSIIESCKMKFDGVNDCRIADVLDILYKNGFSTNSSALDHSIVVYNGSTNFVCCGPACFNGVANIQEVNPDWFINKYAENKPVKVRTDPTHPKGMRPTDFRPMTEAERAYHKKKYSKHNHVTVAPVLNLTEHIPGYNMGRLPK